MRHRLLVVANRTVDAPGLLDELERRAAERPIELTLLIPAAWNEHEQSAERAKLAVDALRERGLDVAQAVLGDADPVCAVEEEWDPRRYDEVLVVTLPTGTSRWLQVDLPHRVARLTDAKVEHVEVAPAPPPEEGRFERSDRPRDPFLVRLLSTMRVSLRS
jgi:hypothetical protein